MIKLINTLYIILVRESRLDLFVSMLFYELADGLVAVVLEGGVVSQDFVSDVLGYLLIDTCFAFLVGNGMFIPFHLLLLSLELLDPLGSLLAGDGLGS